MQLETYDCDEVLIVVLSLSLLVAENLEFEAMSVSTFACLSINTDMSNRKPAAKGNKLFGAVRNVATENERAYLPSFIAIQEIGSRNAQKLLKHCSDDYAGFVGPISYDYGVLMWRTDRWKLKSNKDVRVCAMGHYLSVKLYDVTTEETVYLIGTHQVKEGRGFETHRTLNKHIQESYRTEKAESIVSVGDYNYKAGNMSNLYPECEYAFTTDDVKSSKSGCIDNVITPRQSASFTSAILSDVSAFHHYPIIARYAARREPF